MYQAILDFIKSFIPDPELPTGEYLTRLVSLAAITAVIGTLIYFAVSGTVLGARWGLTKTVSDVPNLSHLEFNKDQRESWQALTQLRENDPNVKGAFIAVLYDIKTGNIITKDERKESQAMIWVYSIPGNTFNSIDIIESAISKVKPTYQERFNAKPECYASKLTGEPYQVLRRGIENLQSTHFATCPIYAKKGGYLIAASFLLLTIPPDPLQTPKSPASSEDIISYEELSLWNYQDRLRRATALLDNNFRSFDRPYSFFYR